MDDLDSVGASWGRSFLERFGHGFTEQKESVQMKDGAMACPFCGCFLEKRESVYMVRKISSGEGFKTFARNCEYHHPKNDCILSPYYIGENQIEDWNRRATDDTVLAR